MSICAIVWDIKIDLLKKVEKQWSISVFLFNFVSVSLIYVAMKKLLLFLLLTLCASMLKAEEKHYTVVVSADGFRWDYPLWYDTPFIDYMGREGVSSGLIPSFPSKTFPNHYTLATGLYPDHHGIVANDFYDADKDEVFSLSNAKQKMNPRFYGGEPIWVTAQRQGLHTAIFYWPGSDIKIKDCRPDLFHYYDQKPRLTYAQRIAGIVEQLKKPENERPDLIMAYLEEPDASGHHTGPQSRRTRQAVMQVDSLIHQLYSDIQSLPVAGRVNLILLSDHGMTWVTKEHAVNLYQYLNPRWIKRAEGTVPTNIYAHTGCTDSILTALKRVDHIKVWKKEDLPVYLHYGRSSRVGDVVAMPDLGYVINSELNGGNHGYDPTMQDMHALFRAIGPDFKQHCTVPHFENVNVYTLL